MRNSGALNYYWRMEGLSRMPNSLELLVAIAGPPLSQPIALESVATLVAKGGISSRLGHELASLLSSTNGFFAFESALHVFPCGRRTEGYELAQWNDHALWRSTYADPPPGIFFAEDIFGEQFTLCNDAIYRFDPETGESVEHTPTLEAWAEHIMGHYEDETGYPLAHAWQLRHGALPVHCRLVPGNPFVLGGTYDVDNLLALDAAQGIRLRAEIANQIRNLPDGATVRLQITD